MVTDLDALEAERYGRASLADVIRALEAERYGKRKIVYVARQAQASTEQDARHAAGMPAEHRQR